MARLPWSIFREPTTRAPKRGKPKAKPEKKPVDKRDLFIGGDIQVEMDGFLYRGRITDMMSRDKRIIVQIDKTARTPTVTQQGHGEWEHAAEWKPAFSFGFDDLLHEQGDCYTFAWEGKRCMLFPKAKALDFDERVKRLKQGSAAA
jgi:hypothetical protein